MLLVLWLVCVSLPAQAAPGFLMTTNELAAGETTTFEVQVVGEKPLSAPRIEAPEGVEIEYIGSSPVTVRRGGRLNTYYRFKYEITALEPGDYEIGPAVVEYADGRDEVSITHTLTVAEKGEGLDKPYEADVAYLPEEAWEGQVVIYRYRLRSRTRPSRTRWLEPEHNGLVAPRDGDRPRREYAIQDDDGTIFIDETFIPYIVTGTGDLGLEVAILQLWFATDRSDPLGLFSRHRNETLTLGPAPLKSKGLPPAPAEFSGLVGDFTLEGDFDKTELAVGESATWTLRLSGNGALDGFALPQPEGDGFKIYEAGLRTDAAVREGEYIAESRTRLSVVATRAGTVEVPPLELVVFSPRKGEYVTLRAEGERLQVAPGAGGQTTLESFAPDVDEAAELEEEPPDIRGPWARGLARTVWLGPFLPLFLGAAAVPGLIALGVIGGRRARAWWAARATTEAPVIDPAARLRHLPEDRIARLAEVDAALREALALREGIAVGLLDRAAAIEALDDDARAEAKAISAALDRARFADGPSEGLVERVVALLPKLVREAA